MTKNNIFSHLPTSIDKEVFADILTSENVRIERIVSYGQRSPESGWYDQDENEWVIVLGGSGTLLFEDENEIELNAGDYLLIPAHQRHKVLRTDSEQPTIWLAVFFS
ncbi:cupin domain-containing protein [Methylophaga sp.]|jgi:cupin 2 domain-containing protein|uniref:cupin domain-containing protein n=1 Tax=Methylophaga sp. TaxID=2024840 RepID=UPI0013FF35DC|nr:cupin domain-containing protein [Methylophaga sp.]MTI64045.1 cupin domain-containing protein [Methylophaga sp.]